MRRLKGWFRKDSCLVTWECIFRLHKFLYGHNLEVWIELWNPVIRASHWPCSVFYLGLHSVGCKRWATVSVTKCLQAEFCLLCLHQWSRLLASLVSFRFVLEQWVNQSSYIHPCLQFALIYEQGITQPNLRLICHLSLRCTGKVFSCYK